MSGSCCGLVQRGAVGSWYRLALCWLSTTCVERNSNFGRTASHQDYDLEMRWWPVMPIGPRHTEIFGSAGKVWLI